MQSQVTKEVTPYESLNTNHLVFILLDYTRRVLDRGVGNYEFQIPREALIAEIERMVEWLKTYELQRYP